MIKKFGLGLLLTIGVWSFVLSQRAQEVAFQDLLTYDTTYIEKPSNILNLSAPKKFYSAANGTDIWIGQAIKSNATKLGLFEYQTGKTVCLRLPKAIVKAEQGWGPTNIFLDSSHVLVQFSQYLALYAWESYGRKAKLVDTLHLLQSRHAAFVAPYFYSIRDYVLSGNDNHHQIEKIRVSENSLTKETTYDYQWDIPEYCVFGSNFRYAPHKKGIFSVKVGQPYLYFLRNGQSDSISLMAKTDWMYPDYHFLDSLRQISPSLAKDPGFWINACSDYKEHHSRVEALEWITDDLLYIRYNQPRTDKPYTPGTRSQRSLSKYEIVDIRSMKLLYYGNNYGVRKTDSTMLTKDNINCLRLTSAKNGLWNDGIGYEITWSSPLDPLGKTYKEFSQAHKQWLSRNEPVIRIRRFLYNVKF